MYEFVDQRTHITIGENELDNVDSTDFPGYRSSLSDGDCWDFERFKKTFRAVIINESKNHDFLEFDLIGVDCSIANSLRRIMLAEIPIMAVEKVHYYLNTSVFQEEFLAHRLGLIPIKADPKMFEFPLKKDETHMSAQDTIVFRLQVVCSVDTEVANEYATPERRFRNRNVYSRQLEWEPLNEQTELFASDPPRPVHGDILLAKLSPGQEIDLKLICVKGIGRDHAKFSPVATAFYRFHPEIQLIDVVEGEQARKLASCFSPGVIKISKRTGRAEVMNARDDAGSRNVFLYPELKNKVKLGFRKDHFIFNVESTGSLTAKEIVMQSFDILINKCRKYLNEMEREMQKKAEKKSTTTGGHS